MAKLKQHKSQLSTLVTFSLRQRAVDLLVKSLGLLIFLWLLSPASASAQIGTGGGLLQIIGMVQVEPGPNVLTFKVKTDEIRFVVHDITSRDRDFTMAQFFADVRHHTPNVDIKGPEPLLDLLIKERPSKRALKLSGSYYMDSHSFVLIGITPVQEKPEVQF